MNKYRNKKTVVDNITFDSMKEAARYKELKLMLRAKLIADLILQPSFALEVNNIKICKYVADFSYITLEPFMRVIEDVKGMKTPTYRLKKKLMKAIHGIEVQEI